MGYLVVDLILNCKWVSSVALNTCLVPNMALNILASCVFPTFDIKIHEILRFTPKKPKKIS